MPGSFAHQLPPASPAAHDVLSPAAALALALVGTKASTVTVAQLARTLGIRPHPPAAPPGGAAPGALSGRTSE